MTGLMKRWEMDAVGRARLMLKEAPIPEPKPGELLVKVAAVSLNYRDKLMIESGMGLRLAFPFTPGSDLAGTVQATGAGVTRFAPGDRVISTFAPGWIDGAPLGNGRVPPYQTLGGQLSRCACGLRRLPGRTGSCARRLHSTMDRQVPCPAPD